MSVHKNVDANKIVPKAIGFSKKGNLTIFKTCMFAAIIATVVYMYKPASPKNFNNIRTLLKLIIKRMNQVTSIEIELNISTKPSKLKINN